MRHLPFYLLHLAIAFIAGAGIGLAISHPVGDAISLPVALGIGLLAALVQTWIVATEFEFLPLRLPLTIYPILWSGVILLLYYLHSLP